MPERTDEERDRKVTSIDSKQRLVNSPKQDEHAAAKHEAPTGVQPVEPEDAYLTGGSRSLQRRLLGLNVEGEQGQAKPHPDATAAGLHSTGSYTKEEGKKPEK